MINRYEGGTSAAEPAEAADAGLSYFKVCFEEEVRVMLLLTILLCAC
jgi:hypothetical protein